MGRIQDAMARLEGRKPENAPPPNENPRNAPNGKVNGHGILPDSVPAGQFDFVSYSLNPVLTEVRGDSTPLREVPRPTAPEPAKEPVKKVELDVERLDP